MASRRLTPLLLGGAHGVTRPAFTAKAHIPVLSIQTLTASDSLCPRHESAPLAAQKHQFNASIVRMSTR